MMEERAKRIQRCKEACKAAAEKGKFQFEDGDGAYPNIDGCYATRLEDGGTVHYQAARSCKDPDYGCWPSEDVVFRPKEFDPNDECWRVM